MACVLRVVEEFGLGWKFDAETITQVVQSMLR